MPEFKLIQGQKASLKVINIRPTGKEVQKQDGLYFQHYITFENKQKETVECEYLSPIPKQDKFFMGVQQWLEVKYLSRKGTPEIVPVDNPDEALPPSAPPAPAAAQQYVDPEFKSPDITKKDLNCFAVPVNGKSIAVAMQLAKDLLVAEIAANPRQITVDDINRMIGWADIINAGICNRINF